MSEHEAPAQDEGRTPMWLTALGAALMIAVAVWWVSPHRDSADATIRVPAAVAPDAADGANAPAERPSATQERPTPTGKALPMLNPRVMTPTIRVPGPPGPPAHGGE